MKRKDFIESTDYIIELIERGMYVATCNQIANMSNDALSKYLSIFQYDNGLYIPISFSSNYPETARIFAVKWFQLQCLEDKSYLDF